MGRRWKSVGTAQREHLSLSDFVSRAEREIGNPRLNPDISARCLLEIREALSGTAWHTETFGSTVTGLATHASDLDVAIHTDGAETADYADRARLALQAVSPLVSQHCNFKLLEDIQAAKIPVLKFRYHGKLDVDISLKTSMGFKSTRLLKAYAEMGVPVQQLVKATKQWAQTSGVCGAASQFLSSYLWTLMAIYFLQVQFALPCIDVDDCLCEASTWACDATLASLVHAFFHFYACKFQWGTEIITVRLGRRIFQRGPDDTDLSGGMAFRIHIEDPFRPSKNLNCVLGAAQECVLRERLCEVARRWEFLPVENQPFQGSGDWTDDEAAQAEDIAERCCAAESAESIGRDDKALMALVRLLVMGEFEAQRKATKAVAHLCYHHLEAQDRLMQHTALAPSLVRLLEPRPLQAFDAEPDVRDLQRCAAQALANICYRNRVQQEAVSCCPHAVASLVRLLERSDAVAARWAARAFVNLCEHPAIQRNFCGNCRAVTAISRVLTHGSREGRTQAAKVIANICYKNVPVQEFFASHERVLGALSLLARNGDSVAEQLLSAGPLARAERQRRDADAQSHKPKSNGHGAHRKGKSKHSAPVYIWAAHVGTFQ